MATNRRSAGTNKILTGILTDGFGFSAVRIAQLADCQRSKPDHYPALDWQRLFLAVKAQHGGPHKPTYELLGMRPHMLPRGSGVPTFTLPFPALSFSTGLYFSPCIFPVQIGTARPASCRRPG